MASVEVDTPSSSTAVVVSLEEDDIEDASLEKPLETKTIPQLRWWLVCHGIEPPTSEKKPALIQRYKLNNACSSYYVNTFVTTGLGRLRWT